METVVKHVLCTLAFAVLLTGCAATNPPLPVYTDPFSNLVNQSSAGVPVDKPMTPELPIGLILSDNVETYVQYAKAGQEGMKSYGALTNTVAVADIDPTFVANRVLVMLKNRYPDMVLVPDFNQAIAEGLRSVVLLDFRVGGPGTSGTTTTVDVGLFFFDAGMIPRTHITGHGSAVVPYPAWDPQVQVATDQAMAELQPKFDAFIQ